MHSKAIGLCSNLCSLLGLPLPDLRADEDGALCFTVAIKEIEIGFVADERVSADHIQYLVHFGSAPDEREPLVLRELLHANLLSQQPGAPVFARDPQTGEVVLAGLLQLGACPAEQVLAGLVELVDSAISWRNTHRVVQNVQAGDAARRLLDRR